MNALLRRAVVVAHRHHALAKSIRRTFRWRSERDLRPVVTYRTVIGGFRSDWRRMLCRDQRSVVGTAKRRDVDACQAINPTLRGQTDIQAG